MNMQEYVKTIVITFKKPYVKIIMNLDSVVETKIIESKPCNTPILIVEYRGYKNYDYFNFLHLEMAQELKKAIDEKREYAILEDI